ncbi:uncharacterized protein LOC142903644 isoform X2 [Nelusetta ayraudi]|uniref:uncharacterized protein LOC142903644 isoform X2 n=1 Tax=Nelusetta ayraudi TaxID=303726 RepID=UPI003F6FCAB4
MDPRGWGTQETRCLIAIWSEESIQRRLDDSYRNRRIYEEISKQMREKGYSRSWLQCQRKIKHLKVLYRKTKDSNRTSGRDMVTCPFYEELDIVLADRPSLCPGAGHVVETNVDYIVETIVGDVVETKVEYTQDDESLSSSLVAETQGVHGDCDETMGPDAAAFAFDSLSSSTSKRKSTSMHGQTRKKKTRFEATLEAFTKAMDSTKDDELLREMQREQHAHEERMLDRMTQSITSIISTVASAQHPPVQGPPNPCYFMPHSGNTGHHQNAPFNPPRQTSQLDEDNSNGLIHLSPSTCRVEPAGFTPLDPSVKVKTESDDSPPSQNSLELDSITPTPEPSNEDHVAAADKSAGSFLAKAIHSMEENVNGTVNMENNTMPEAGDLTEYGVSEAQIRVLRTRLRIMQEELDQVSSEFYKKDEENAQLNSKIKEIEEDRAKLQKMTNAQRAQIEKQKAFATESERKCEVLQSQVSALNKEIEDLKRSHKQSAALHSSTDVRLNRALEEVEKLKAQLNEVTQRNKMHYEAGKMLSFAEDEFMSALDSGEQ